MTLATQAHAVFLLSWYKPLLFLLVIGGWAWVACRLDKDAAYFYLPRQSLNLALLGAAVVAVGLMLLIPYFWIGWVLAILILAGSILGYAWYRNQKVPAEAVWTFSMETFTRRLDDYQQAQAQKTAAVTLMKRDGSPLDVPHGDDPDAPAHTVLAALLEFVLERKGEQIDLAVDSQQVVVVARVDGVKYAQPAMEPAVAVRLLAYLKRAADLDAAERRKRQVGTFQIIAEGLGKHQIQIETVGSTRGLRLTLRIDANKRVHMPLDQMGLLGRQQKQLHALIEAKGKVVIIAGPSHAGLSTTLYSLANQHDPYTSSVVALEHEAHTELEGVDHQQLADGATADQINDRLSAILRADPQTVLLSRLADARTAQIMARYAEEVRFYFTLPQDDTFTALRMWVKLVGDRKLAANGLGAIITQRLVRKLCTTCRTPYKPDPAALRKMNLPVKQVDQLYQASGQVMIKDKPRPCPDCHGMAYTGLTGVFEVMMLDDAARALLAANEVEPLRAHLRKQGMLYLQEAALRKVVDGVTDIKEVTRVLGDQPALKTKAPSAESAKTESVKSPAPKTEVT